MTVNESAPFDAHPIDATTVAVSGEIDVDSAPHLAAALADPIVERVIMTAVSFIDAAGLDTLLEAHRSRQQGLILYSPSRCVLRLLDLAGHCTTFRLATARQ